VTTLKHVLSHEYTIKVHLKMLKVNVTDNLSNNMLKQHVRNAEK